MGLLHGLPLNYAESRVKKSPHRATDCATVCAPPRSLTCGPTSPLRLGRLTRAPPPLLIAAMLDMIDRLYDLFLPPSTLLAPEYLLVTLGIVYLFYRLEKRRGRVAEGFWAWAMPKRIWRHRSTRLDVELFVLGRILTGLGLFARLSLTTIVALWITQLLGDDARNPLVGPVVVALALWMGSDMATYWSHRIFHRTRVLWPLHAVHHSAEVMTPISAYRQHPLGQAISTVMQTLLIGTVQGIVAALLAPDTSAATFAGVNVFTVAAHFAFANLHHSHIWMRFPRWLEHLFISPAQHQIHHSTLPEHHNANYGGTLALWDWMFGSLILSEGIEQPPIGLTSKADRVLMRHGFWGVMIDPVKRMLRVPR